MLVTVMNWETESDNRVVKNPEYVSNIESNILHFKDGDSINENTGSFYQWVEEGRYA